MFGIKDLTQIQISPLEIKRNIRADGDFKGYNDSFVYPAGNIGAIGIPLAISKGIRVKLNHNVSLVNIKNKMMVVNGEQIHWSHLISTIPLRELIQITEDVPPTIKQKANKLQYSNGMILNLGIKNMHDELKRSWDYVPEMDFGFYRIGYYSNVIPELAPKGYNSLYVECSPLYFKNKEEAEAMIPKILNDLIKYGLIDSLDDIVVQNIVYMSYNYCLPNPQLTNELRNYLASNQIYSIGRYGTWYWSSQHDDMKQAIDLAQKLLNIN